MGSEAASTPFFKQGLKRVIEAGHLRFVAVDEEYRPRIEVAVADEVVDDLEEERRLIGVRLRPLSQYFTLFLK